MNSVGSNNVSLKYQRPTPFGCKDIGIRKFEFVAKTQFLYPRNIQLRFKMKFLEFVFLLKLGWRICKTVEYKCK